MTKIAVCSAGESLSSDLDGRFGRCAYLILWDQDSDSYEAIPNQAGEQAHGSGTSTAQILVTKGVQKLIVSRIGPKAYEVVAKSGIKVYRAEEDQTVQAVLDKCLEGDLQELHKPNN
ncbi:MAG: dinitrogenase iron-molybdenum cofactor biosynthesis protein [Syntrophomonadaceae bacterium]|jgi:predicted Fe-Mo cluster-binding NifX family protein|nr:dinitrogenase iron-molybdenum cofactor biosynthesis protein [Syntrophomonadaceae bacterium]